ncbi:MAG: amidohydrolase family protein [Alphaproteobacteria bacterium]
MLRRRTVLASSLALAAAASLQGVARGAPLAPFKLFDTHVHFHSNDPVKYPFRADMAPALRADTIAHPVTPDILFKIWDDAGVERGCGVQLNFAYYTDNRYLLAVAEKYPNRISPIVVLEPADPATPAALEAMAKAYGVSGVRFAGSPDAAGNYLFLSDGAKGAWETADDLGLAVVLLPVRPDQPQILPAAMKRIGVLADKYPNVRIVLDHVGFPVAENSPTFGFSAEHLALVAHKNVYYKYTTFLMAQLRTAGVPLKDFLNYAVGVYGADHFVWGSAVGNNEVARRGTFAGGEAMSNPERYGELVKLALDSAEGLTLAQKTAMFHNTAKGLFIPGGRAAPFRRP